MNLKTQKTIQNKMQKIECKNKVLIFNVLLKIIILLSISISLCPQRICNLHVGTNYNKKENKVIKYVRTREHYKREKNVMRHYLSNYPQNSTHNCLEKRKR